EVHRFNKSQQDAFLPHIEDGTVTFIGATTENPSFELNSALLSRARVYLLKSLSPEDIEAVLIQALNDSERGLGGQNIVLPDET
ncbi:recombination factor protein RarA, partial [Pseudomonas aeruginosa]